MSNFLSQLEINPQVDNDDVEIEREDIERDKEIKEFLDNELDDDDLFDDESSFTSHQTPLNQIDSPTESLYEYQDMPNIHNSQSTQRKIMSGPLLTSRGSNFLKQASTKSDMESAEENNENWQSGTQDSFRDYNSLQNHRESSTSASYTKTQHRSISDQEKGVYYDNHQNYHPWEYNDYHSTDGPMASDYMQAGKNEIPISADGVRISGEKSDFAPDSFHRHFSADNDNDFKSFQVIQLDDNMKNPAFNTMHTGAENFSSGNDFHYSNEIQGRDTKVNAVSPTHDNIKGYQYDTSHNDSHASMFHFESNQTFDNQRYGQSNKDQNDNNLISNENAQLRIIYDARGRKIEELQRSAQEKAEEKDKEKRILQHRITLITGERDGLSASHEQAMNLLREAKSETEEVKICLSDEKEINQKLKLQRNELVEKLEISESTIDSLNQQLTALNQADSLHKMRSQHETILATIRQKHEEDMLHLKEKFDDTKKELNWKTEDVNRLQDELQLAKKITDQAKIEAAQTINKLTKSLEQSQRQCREILEEGSVNEIGELKYQLKQTIKEKCQYEEKCKQMTDELKELKDQLTMYEAALESSAKGPTSSTPYNDKTNDVKWAAGDSFKTPLSRFRNQAGLAESPVYSLRDELIKALANNRSKREELNNAKAKVDILEHQLETANQSLKQLEIENETLKSDVKASCEVKQTGEERATTKLVENAKTITDLQKELELCEKRITELQGECDQYQNENCRLKTDITEIMQQFDKDKLEALKNCEKTYLQFNEDSKISLEQRLKETHQQEIAALREEMKNLNNELLDVKDSYVAIANENKVIEQEVRSECQREAEEHLKELKSNLEELSKESLTKLEESLMTKHHLELENEIKKLKNENEEELKHRIETAIALAKVDWFASYEEEKSAAIERAVENAKAKWVMERNVNESSNIQEMFQQLKEEWETAKQDEFDQRLTKAVKTAKSEWQETAKRDTERAIERAVEECNRKNKSSKQNEIEEAIIAAKESWEKDARRMKDSITGTMKEMEILAKETEHYKAELSQLHVQIKQKEADFDEKCKEINAKKEADIEYAVSHAKAEWKNERDVLRQQILQEESQRIRTELLASFAEYDLQDIVGKERSPMEDIVEKNHVNELKDIISLIKESYEKKFQENKESTDVVLERAKETWISEEKKRMERLLKEQKAKLNEEFGREKLGIIAEADNKLQAEMLKIEKRFEEHSKENLKLKLDKRKDEWKTELESLQKEHVEALSSTVNEIKTKYEKENENLRRQFNEFIRKMKRENAEKLEKQKIDLDAYHGNLTKRTLELARKEWELESSFRSRYDRKNKRALSESNYNTTQPTYSKQENAFETVHLESSDSGFTSPFSKTSHTTRTPQNQDNLERTQTSMDQSPPYEMMLEKLEANILHLKGDGDLRKEALSVKQVSTSTQTDGNNQDNEAILEDMRQYYLETVRKINDDVLNHISKTKENAAANLRKEIQKEKKALISRIRKSSIKNLKGSQSNNSTDAKKIAVFAALKEVELEDNEAEVPIKDWNEKKNKTQLVMTVTNENRQDKNQNMAPPLSPIFSSPISKRQSKVPVYRKPSTRRDSSPSNSMFSCESNGTFYTELPPSLNATPITERSRFVSRNSNNGSKV